MRPSTHHQDSDHSRRRSAILTLKTLSTHLWPKDRSDLKFRVLLALGCLILAKAINVYVPLLYKDAIDLLSVKSSALILPLGLIIAYGGARVLHQAFGELRDLVFVKVSQHAQRTIALQTFKQLHRLSLKFHLDRQTGGLSTIIQRGLRGIQFVLSFMLFNILPTILEILLVAAILLYKFDYRFALITLFTIGFYIFFTLYFTEWRLKFRRKMNEKDSEANTKSVDSLLNYETVKYFNNEEHEFRRYDLSLAEYERAAVKSQNTLSFLNVGQGAIIGVGLIWITILAGEGVVSGAYTIGDFVLVNTYLIQLYLPLNFLGFVYREIKHSLTDMEKMFELLEEGQEIQDRSDAKSLDVKSGEIEFRDVGFKYTDRDILKGISFKIPSGKTVAVVGPSGSGKSTIARLLFRFYDVNSGAIFVDGQDVRLVRQSTLRANIGVVPQDTVLFNDTIGYNIGYGNPEASSDQVAEAARLADLDEFVQGLPKKYETAVGERGLKLSGGEKQRVAIARTILKNPRILIFDEATSALDSHTEKNIQASLSEVSQNRTTLVIAHRLSTVVDSDQILVLKDGKIAEQGRHQELLEKGGEYAAMWNKQQEVQDIEAKLKAAHQ